MAFSFGTNSGPSGPAKASFGEPASCFPPPPRPNPSPSSHNEIPFSAAQPPVQKQQTTPRPQRPAMYRSWDNQPIKSPQGLSSIAVSSITGDSGSNIPTYPGNVNFAERTKSPPLPSYEEDILGLYSPPDANARWSTVPSSWENLPNQPSSSYVRSPQRLSPVAARKNARDTEANFSMKPDSFNFAKRTRSPPLPTHEDDILGLYNPPNVNARRLSPPPSLSWQPEGQVSLPSTNNQRLSPVLAYGNAHGAVANFLTDPIGLHVAKKTKSPPLPSHENNSLEMNNHSFGNDRRITKVCLKRRR